MNQLIWQYSYLQVLDLLTTLAFLVNGVREGNPLVRFAISYTHSPLAGLALIKIAAIGLGVFCWRTCRYRLLGRMNIIFALVVAWNIAALIIGSASHV